MMRTQSSASMMTSATSSIVQKGAVTRPPTVPLAITRHRRFAKTLAIPKVIRFRGRAIITSTGRNIILNAANARATQSADSAVPGSRPIAPAPNRIKKYRTAFIP